MIVNACFVLFFSFLFTSTFCLISHSDTNMNEETLKDSFGWKFMYTSCAECHWDSILLYRTDLDFMVLSFILRQNKLMLK